MHKYGKNYSIIICYNSYMSSYLAAITKHILITALPRIMKFLTTIFQ